MEVFFIFLLRKTFSCAIFVVTKSQLTVIGICCIERGHGEQYDITIQNAERGISNEHGGTAYKTYSGYVWENN